MAKINISIPDELLADVDALAAELERSRSGLVAEATARYVASAKDERAEAERRARIDHAMTEARAIGRKVGSFDSTAAIRADRDRDWKPEDPR
ncbi:MAG: ribbon-helix-helix protein, CopG family [Coriobacteriia bacterium]|nr:ribbon-helix-helix protein, CopG family [Coriobacteriia bacterium]